FTFVEDAVRANLLAADVAGVSGKVYNIACGNRTSLLELVARINNMLDTAIQPVHDDARPGDVRHSQADISRARADLGYCPGTDVTQGLRRCLDHFLAESRPNGAPARAGLGV